MDIGIQDFDNGDLLFVYTREFGLRWRLLYCNPNSGGRLLEFGLGPLSIQLFQINHKGPCGANF